MLLATRAGDDRKKIHVGGRWTLDRYWMRRTRVASAFFLRGVIKSRGGGGFPRGASLLLRKEVCVKPPVLVTPTLFGECLSHRNEGLMESPAKSARDLQF